MKLIPLTVAAALVLAVSGCSSADTAVPDVPSPVNVADNNGEIPSNDTSADSGSASGNDDGSQSVNVELSTFQAEKMLAAVDASIEKALESGYAETYAFAGEDFSSTVLYDPTRPMEEAAALDIGDGLSIPAFATSTDEVITGLLEMQAEATAMIGIIESGADEAAQYVNIVTNDGFIFAGTGSGKRFHVVTDSDGIVISFTETNPEGDRTHSFSYELTSEQKQSITNAYNLAFGEE